MRFYVAVKRGGTFDIVSQPCQSRGMGVNYTIVPRGRGYWIIASDKEGSRPIERFDTEDRAVRRLRELQEPIYTRPESILLQPKRHR
jgi:hypothetical protein